MPAAVIGNETMAMSHLSLPQARVVVIAAYKRQPLIACRLPLAHNTRASHTRAVRARVRLAVLERADLLPRTVTGAPNRYGSIPERAGVRDTAAPAGEWREGQTEAQCGQCAGIRCICDHA